MKNVLNRLALLPLALLAGGLFATQAQAATITVVANGTTGVVYENTALRGDCSLVGAIINANTDSTSGDPDCEAGSGADTIVLPKGATFTLTAIHNPDDGDNGLPQITSPISIKGNGSIIERDRSNGVPRFRIFQVGSPATNVGGALSLDRITVRNGHSTGQGGAIEVAVPESSLVLTSSTLSGNVAETFGGALVATGSVSITDSTISGNTAVIHGGGLYLENVAAATLTNSTLHGNTAAYQGGGIYLGGTATLANVTVTANSTSDTTGEGAGIFVGEVGILNLANSIVAGNRVQGADIAEIKMSSGINGSATINVSGRNLYGDSGLTTAQAISAAVPSTNRILATSNSDQPRALSAIFATSGTPAVPLLANNGGPTQTVALVMNSPAIDQSGDGPTNTDQRGYTRSKQLILGILSVRDIGAFEFNGVAPTPTVTALSPTTGPAAGGTVVTITGTNFTGATGVRFGETAATNVTVVSATSITATAPAGTGTKSVFVSTPEGISANNGTADDFTYAAADVNGACGSASGVSSSTAPAANLCATGTATAVSGSSTAWTWGCNGSGSGTSTAATACAANYPKPTLTLNATASSIKVGDGTTVTSQSDNGLAPTLSTSTSSICSFGTTVGNSSVTAPVTGTAQGACTVAANQAAVTSGTTRYLAADEKTVNIAVSKKDQTIGTPSVSPSTIVVGNTSTVSATATSGLSVSYSASPNTVCTHNGGTITGVGAGNCTVIVSQNGDSTYNAALGQFASITVQAVPVNGACGSASGTSSATAPAANLCTTGAATPVSGNNGAWGWTCMGQNGGTTSNACTASYASQTLSLSATPTSIEAGRTSSILASSNSGLTVSLLASGTPANACTLSGTTLSGVNEGNCTVTASQAGTGDSGSQRYLAATPVSTTVTVTKPSSACKAYETRANVNILDYRASPGGQTVRGDAAKFNVIYGSGFADTITGGNAGNCIDGGAGNDRLTAGAGENYLYGGDGSDTLTPGSGSTLMDGGAGTDKCVLASSRATAAYTSCESN